MALPNFLKLYSQLDLHPDCSLDDFKHAYRRRIAELHPDRPEAVLGGDRDEVQLSDLNSTYAAAIRFHKQHGRLPGGKPNPVRSVPVGFVKRDTSLPQVADIKPQGRSTRGATYHERLAVLTALALVLLCLYLMLEYL